MTSSSTSHPFSTAAASILFFYRTPKITAYAHVISDLQQACVELNEKGKVSTYNYIQLHHVITKTNIRPPAHKDKDYVEPPGGYNICHKNTYINKILGGKKNVDVDKYQPGCLVVFKCDKNTFYNFPAKLFGKNPKVSQKLKVKLGASKPLVDWIPLQTSAEKEPCAKHLLSVQLCYFIPFLCKCCGSQNLLRGSLWKQEHNDLQQTFHSFYFVHILSM